MRRAAAVLTLLALAGCGGAKHAAPRIEGPYGKGADQVWLVRPAGKPRSVVVFLHGLGDATEDTPLNHEQWLLHLAQQGSAVIYPRYEAAPTIENQPTVDQHALRGVALGLKTLGIPKVPAVLIGYSRGGPLAVDLASVATMVGLEPRGILTVFPASRYPNEPPLDLRTISPAEKIWVMFGDRDRVVGEVGAAQLIHRLEVAGFPKRQLRLLKVVSHGDFAATHLSVLSDSKAAKAAYWGTADSLIAGVR